MLDTLQKAVHNIFTGKDNHTEDAGRVFGAVGFVALIAYMFISHPSFIQACTGLGSYITTWGAFLYLKKDTEPA